MRTFDRIVLVVLAVGVWALVLAPQETGAHHQYDDGHSCDVSGSAYGQIQDLEEGGMVYVYDVGFISVDCTHY